LDENKDEFKEEAKAEVKEEIKKDVLERIKKPEIKGPRSTFNWWMIGTIAFLILFLAATFTSGFSGISGMSAVDAGEKSVNFLNDQLLPPGTQASLVSTDVLSGVYKLTLDIDGEEYDSYVTKDGSLFFISAIELGKPLFPETNDSGEIEAPEPAAAFDAPDSEKPTVELFVMSFCPYGQQAENNIVSAIELFEDSIEFEPHFIVNVDNNSVGSLHGTKEADEDMRQACIWKYYPETFWDYVMYVNENIPLDNINEQWTEAAEAVDLDVESIETCVEQEGLELMQAESDLADELGVTGSPTLLINGEKYFGERTPEAFKQAICSGFEEQPEVCSETLEEEGSAATGSC